MTLDKYAEVELDDVKREFAKLDLSATPIPRQDSRAMDLVGVLRNHAPLGSERAWEMVLHGLMELLGTKAQVGGTPLPPSAG